MSETRTRIYRAMLDREDGMGLHEIAREVGLDSSPTLHHLRTMEREGGVERFLPPGSVRPRYRLRPFFSAFWMDPASHVFASWAVRDRISWRFPLASRIEDDRARQTALAFLRLADRSGVFRPEWRRVGDHRKRASKALPPVSEADRERALGIRVVAYGSVVTGGLGARSDLDLLALVGAGRGFEATRDELLDLAASVNLEAPRHLDLKVFTEGTLLESAPRFARNVERDSMILYSSYEGGEYEPVLVEAP